MPQIAVKSQYCELYSTSMVYANALFWWSPAVLSNYVPTNSVLVHQHLNI